MASHLRFLFRYTKYCLVVSCLLVPMVFNPLQASIPNIDGSGIPSCLGRSLQGFGPHDYRDPKGKLEIVERFHFFPEVEQLRFGGQGNNTLKGLGSNIDYTLRAFPNHYRALMAMIKFQDKYKQSVLFKRIRIISSMECYFDRAIAIFPDDGVATMLYGIYYHKKRDYNAAKEKYLAAQANIPDNPELHYNFGLLYIELKDYEQALQHAHRAYQAGYRLPFLKERLKKLNKWQDPVSVTPDAGEASEQRSEEP